MKSIYEYDHYKAYVNDWIAHQPQKGRGQFRRISKLLRCHPTLVSHIFRGEKDLSSEQAALIAGHFSLNSSEEEFFILLVQINKTSSDRLKKILLKRCRQIASEKKFSLADQIPFDLELPYEVQSVFYSSWHYSAIRLLVSLKKVNYKKDLYQYFHLPRNTIDQALNFLVSKKLIVVVDDRLSMGPAVTHVGSRSDFVSKHHMNWRLKATERHVQMEHDELAFSGPLTLSKKDADRVRQKLVEFLKELAPLVKKSEAEELRCLNIDWLRVH